MQIISDIKLIMWSGDEVKMKKYIPLSVPNMSGNEKKYVLDAIEKTWVSTGGAYITEFESKLAAFLETGSVAACQSGTAALHLALQDCGVQRGDVVIVPTLTFIAAVNPVVYQAAEPVFMDCDDSLCMDSEKLREFCEKECEYQDGKLRYGRKHVKALVVVHVFGNMADMEAIMDIADKYHIKVIEDATEALGSYYTQGRYRGMYAGTIGDYGAYSFNGNKIITTGGGGAVTAKDPEAVKHMRYLSTQAKDDPHYYIHHEIGYNYRMTNVQAALGVAQMEQLPGFIEKKQVNYDLYQKLFSDCGECRLLSFKEGTNSNKWFYSLQIKDKKIHASMKEIIEKLENSNIQTRAVWGLIHQQRPYQEASAYRIVRAIYYSKCILNIPASTNLTKEDIVYVADEIRRILKGLANE